MSYRTARRQQDRVNLDRLVRIRRYTVRSDVTGGYIGPATTDEQVWCLRQEGRSELNVGEKQTELVSPSAVIVRWDPRLESLDAQRITVSYPETPDREDRATNVEQVGRRRYLRLEVDA